MKNYNKEHYKQFKVELRINELEELNELLKQDNMTKADFLRKAIDDYKFTKQFKVKNDN